MQIESLDEQLQKKHLVKSLKKFKSKSLGGPNIPLILFNRNRTYRRILPCRLSGHEILILRSLSPLQSSPKVRDQSYHKSSPLLYLIVSTSTSRTNPPPRNAHARSARCRSRDVNARGKPWSSAKIPRMALMGTGIWAGNGLGRDTRASRPNRAKRTKETSGKRKEAKAEEAAKEDRGEEPMKENMFVATDEQGRLKMLPVRARTTQLDEEPGASANGNL